jgi:Tubulin binding cofactor A
MYQEEAEVQKRKLEKLTAEMAEEWDVKNAVCASVLIFYNLEYWRLDLQTRMMEEADKMIKDSSQRLRNAVEDLKAIVVSFISACSRSWSPMFPAVVCQARSRGRSRTAERRKGINGGRERH